MSSSVFPENIDPQMTSIHPISLGKLCKVRSAAAVEVWFTCRGWSSGPVGAGWRTLKGGIDKGPMLIYEGYTNTVTHTPRGTWPHSSIDFLGLRFPRGRGRCPVLGSVRSSCCST